MSATVFDLRGVGHASDRLAGERTFVDPADRRLVIHPEADAVFVEQFRRVGAALHQAQIQEGVRSVMVASAVEAEGKTLSAANLAFTLSRSFKKRVLLVDGDLRKPSVHHLLQIENGSGFSDFLKRSAGRLPLRMVSPTLSVVTGGTHDPDPVALLASDGLRHLLVETRDQFDWLVVDTPPVVLFPDAELFASRLDTCVMVVGAGTTASTLARKAVEAIGPSRILGVVLNRAERADVAAGRGYGYYGYAEGRSANRRFSFWRSRR